MKAFYTLAAAALLLASLPTVIASARSTSNSTSFNSPTPLPCEGTIILDSQADVDSFRTFYPCSEINGNILISGPDIVNLAGLDSVRRINGGLTISGNPGLTTGAGLRRLQFVGHDPTNPEYAGLKVAGNPNLTSIFDMVSLTEIDGSLRIENNARMSSISSLSWLETVGTEQEGRMSILIRDNPSLFVLRGLNLKSVEGPISISGNTNLREIDSFWDITEISGFYVGLIIANNNSLVDLSGFSRLTAIRGDHAFVLITNNLMLPNLTGLRALTAIEGTTGSELRIVGNSSITELRGLSGLTSMGNNPMLTVTDNQKLTEGCGLYSVLSNLNNMGASVTISGNGAEFSRESILAGGPCPKVCYSDVTLASQAEVNAFASSPCGQITGTLTITGPDITNLDSLYSLQRTDGTLAIVNNPLLESISGLSSLTLVGPFGYGVYPGLHVTNNPKLTSLDGLDSLKSIGGLLNIENNATLENIDGLSALNRIGAPFPSGTSVIITDNPALQNLHGLKSITVLTGDLFINNNDSLHDLGGLDSLTDVGGGEGAFLHITSNESLESLHGLDALESLVGRTSWLKISDNPKLLNLDGLEKLREFGGVPPIVIEIRNNELLQHADALSGITLEYTPDPYLTVVDNPNLTGGCGFYGMLANESVDAEFSGNGVTEEQIIAGGSCGTECIPPLDRDVFAEHRSGRAPHSTNIIVGNYEPGVMYELHKESDSSLVAGPYPGNVGLFVQNLTETTTFFVIARRDGASSCQAEMIERVTINIFGDSTDCSGVIIADKQVVAEQDTLASGEATNILVLRGALGVQYLLRNDADNDTLAGPFYSTVGLYTGAVYATTTYNVVAIDQATGCSAEMSTLVTITVPEDGFAAERVAVYPNPSEGEFVVDVKNHSNVSRFTVIDATGAVVKSQHLNGSSGTSVDLKSAVPGIYYLSVYKVDGSVESKRLVIR